MEIVIRMSKEKYEEFKDAYRRGYSGAMIDLDIILGGDILPKEHGRLIDMDTILNADTVIPSNKI